ncbi:flavin oxidoreductase [marine bacterium AO1-C]|nr:flavin oxidoreductase [marine bacterium AO1-C]
MHLTKQDIENTERVRRLNIINAITGIKPANLIGTIDAEGVTNLAVFSSVVHLGSNPALLGFILRPQGEVRRHTYENLLVNGEYTINHIHRSFIEQAHYTSAKFDKGISEFTQCGFTEEYLPDFKAPFVKESSLKLGMRFLEEIPIKVNNTSMIIGEVAHLVVPDAVVNDKGYINLAQLEGVGIGGLNNYYGLEQIGSFPYARVKEAPDFS